ncbi:MAG: hypothetical protein DRI56_09530 [Chloroflexota bacterium]|nr:MAG: hypothetical protein DRI56_09530 [Chloroflexota bacterium]
MKKSDLDEIISVSTTLYGPLAKYGGGKYIAEKNVPLEPESTIADLLNHFKIPPDKKGYLFINAILCDAPGLTASQKEPLHDGDHVGIFSLKHMWPYQYRDGIRMSESLTKTLKERGTMRNTY